MARPHIEFIYAQRLPWAVGHGLAGRDDLLQKRLSADDVSGEFTALLRFPAQWRGTVASPFQEEVYVLDGSLGIDGSTLGRDGYFRVPAHVGHEWHSPKGGVAIVFLNRSRIEDEDATVVIDTPSMVWDRSGVPEELAYMGIGRKPLFVDRDTGLHRTWLLTTAPQIAPAGKALSIETHTCAEELFMLGGDITGPHGVMAPGAYFWRPRETFHGPFGSRDGSLALLRFRDGEQNTRFHDRTRPFSFEAPYRPALPPAWEPEVVGPAGAPDRF